MLGKLLVNLAQAGDDIAIAAAGARRGRRPCAGAVLRRQSLGARLRLLGKQQSYILSLMQHIVTYECKVQRRQTSVHQQAPDPHLQRNLQAVPVGGCLLQPQKPAQQF